MISRTRNNQIDKDSSSRTTTTIIDISYVTYLGVNFKNDEMEEIMARLTKGKITKTKKTINENVVRPVVLYGVEIWKI